MRGASFLSESGVALFPPPLGRDGRCADASAAIASPGYAEQPSVSRLSRGRQARLTFTVLWDVHRRAHLVVEETGPLPPCHEPQTWPQRACPEGSLLFSGRRKARSRAELRVTPKPRPASESRPGQARSRPPPVFPSRAPLLAPSPARSLARTSPPLGLFSFSAVESEQHCIWQHGLHLDWNPGSNAF